MTAQLELEVYQHLVRYLTEQEDFHSFRTWFDENTWDSGSWNSPLLGHIELALAELSSERMTDSEFRESLRTSIPATIELPPIAAANIPKNVTGTSNTVKLVPAFGRAELESASQTPSRTLWQPAWQFQPA